MTYFVSEANLMVYSICQDHKKAALAVSLCNTVWEEPDSIPVINHGSRQTFSQP